METKFNFNSQACSSIEQSRRLLALGLKKETADMYWTKPFNEWFPIVKRGNEKIDDENIPVWSLHRLISLVPRTIKDMLALCVYNNAVIYDGLGYVKEFKASESLYDNLIDCIAWLIENEYMYQDYMED